MNYRTSRIPWRNFHRFAWNALPVLFVVGVTLMLVLFVLTVLGVDTGTKPVEEPASLVVHPTTYTQDAGPVTLQEDDEGWDCRTMGNQMCGVEVMGEWYVLDFATGTFAPRG